MKKQNCWEFKGCGCEKPGNKGICPAVTARMADGTNHGKNGGRVCWAISGTCCDGSVQGSYAQKIVACTECDFRIKVKEEEGYSFKTIYF